MLFLALLALTGQALPTDGCCTTTTDWAGAEVYMQSCTVGDHADETACTTAGGVWETTTCDEWMTANADVAACSDLVPSELYSFTQASDAGVCCGGVLATEPDLGACLCDAVASLDSYKTMGELDCGAKEIASFNDGNCAVDAILYGPTCCQATETEHAAATTTVLTEGQLAVMFTEFTGTTCTDAVYAVENLVVTNGECVAVEDVVDSYMSVTVAEDCSNYVVTYYTDDACTTPDDTQDAVTNDPEPCAADGATAIMGETTFVCYEAPTTTEETTTGEPEQDSTYMLSALVVLIAAALKL